VVNRDLGFPCFYFLLGRFLQVQVVEFFLKHENNPPRPRRPTPAMVVRARFFVRICPPPVAFMS